MFTRLFLVAVRPGVDLILSSDHQLEVEDLDRILSSPSTTSAHQLLSLNGVDQHIFAYFDFVAGDYPSIDPMSDELKQMNAVGALTIQTIDGNVISLVETAD